MGRRWATADPVRSPHAGATGQTFRSGSGARTRAARHGNSRTLRDGQQIAASSLPRTGIQFQFRVPVPHDSVTCSGGSSDGPDRLGWGPEKVTRRPAGPPPLYHVLAEWQPLFPQVGRYRLSAEATDGGKTCRPARGHVCRRPRRSAPPQHALPLGQEGRSGQPDHRVHPGLAGRAERDACFEG